MLARVETSVACSMFAQTFTLQFILHTRREVIKIVDRVKCVETCIYSIIRQTGTKSLCNLGFEIK